MNNSSKPVVRQCYKCGGDVYRNAPYCKTCWAAYMKERYAREPEKYRKLSAKWRVENPEKRKEIDIRQNFKRMGVTQEWYEEKAASQGYVCEICGKDGLDGFRTRLSIDHDHACCSRNKTCENCRRGLICNKCNLMLGSAKDIPEVLERAAEYLERWGK